MTKSKYQPVDLIEVLIWGERVGAVSLDNNANYYAFEYDPNWRKKGIELSPFNLSISNSKPVIFPNLPVQTFQRLPAMLADALPDKFGNALIDLDLSKKGIPKESITPLDRLAYMANRGMGALEFKPAHGKSSQNSTALELSSLVEGAKNALAGKFAGDSESEKAIQRIIQVGVSAGGARAKAVIAWNPESQEICSGHIAAGSHFEHWLIKLDGVTSDRQLGYTAHFGRQEFAYHLMAVDAGIDMMPCRLLEENGRAHFMTKRFDRDGQVKHHMQTLGALRHLDFNAVGVHTYNQYFETIKGLELGDEELQEAFRRMVFNVAAVNCDDHPKNFSFLLRQGSKWQLTPAYDITHAHNPGGNRTNQHLMAVNGKFAQITKADFLEVADRFIIPNANKVISQVVDAVSNWRTFATKANMVETEIQRIQRDIVSTRY
jgi:serine/threonine-protein kinase HipA